MCEKKVLLLITVLIIIALFGGCQPQQGSSLVIVSPERNLDYSELEELLKVYDHYFEPAQDTVQHHLIGEMEDRNLQKLRTLPLTVEVLDEKPENKFYYWVHSIDQFRQELQRRNGRILYTRDNNTVALVVLPDGLTAEDWPHYVRIIPIDFRPIPIQVIAPESYKNTLEKHMMPLPPNVRKDAKVEGMINDVDPESCDLLLRQLTGNAPIEVSGSPYTVNSRHLCSPDMDPLIDWLDAELTATGLTVTIDSFTFPGCPGQDSHRQLVATIPGTDLANQLFLVTAHLDAVRNTQGADDNASGVVAMICAAKELARHRYRRTIQFVAFSAEEQGLVGSSDYVNDLISSGTYQICGAFNMDMIAYDGDSDRKLQIQSNPGDAASAFMRDRLGETITVYGISLNPVLQCDNDGTSDHGSFWSMGKPAVMAGEEYFCETPLAPCDWQPYWTGCPDHDFNPNYHSPADNLTTPNNVQLDLITETAKAMIGVMAYAAIIL